MPEITQPKERRKRAVAKIKVTEPQIIEEASTADLSSLDGTKRQITELLADGTLLADEISQALDMDISQVLSELTELEIDGYIKALAGNRYSL